MLDAAELHLADFTGLNDGREVKISIYKRMKSAKLWKY